MDTLYTFADPTLMAGKTILYVHGFASSGQNGSVRALRTLLPSARILAPDLPVEPGEAMELLQRTCESEHPDLVIGASMGGMYAEMLPGRHRILVNPAFCLADTLARNNGTGRQEFHNPRLDGATSFLVTKGLLEAFREVSGHCFEHCVQEEVYGLFGIHDTLVDTFDLFREHYRNAIRFDGEHYMNDHTILQAVLPLIRRIDDRQNGTERKVLFIAQEALRKEASRDAEPIPGAVKAFRELSASYDTWLLASTPYDEPQMWSDTVRWTEAHFGVPAWDKVILSPRRDLLLGDYLVAPRTERFGTDAFMGTHLPFGEEPFHTWEEILTYFRRLGGQ